MSVPWTIRGRELVYKGFQDLPTIMIVGGLLLGGMTGSIPLIVMSMGGLATSTLYLFIQNIVSSIGLTFLKVPYNSACVSHKPLGYYDVKSRMSIDGMASTWLFSVCYFIGYLFYNAISVIVLDPTTKDDVDKVNSRMAQGISVIIALIVLGIMFVIFRLRTKCENVVTTLLGSTLGLALGLGFFALAQSSDLRIADVLQIKQGMEPIDSSKQTIKPIVCASA